MTRWLNSPDVSLRVSAADILGQLGKRTSAKALIRTLADADPEVRLHAVLALGKLATVEAVVPLIARLGDIKGDVRKAAISELAKLGDPRALIPLVGAMSDSSVEARLAAIRAVGQLGNNSAVPALMRLLSDPSEPIKVAAVAALGNLKATLATDRLIIALGTGSDDFRARSAYALGQIATAETDPDNSRRAIRALVGALENPRTRPAAREALLAAKTVATAGLIEHLRGEIPGHPATAVLLLRDIGDSSATPTLLAELERQRLGRELVLDALSVAGDKRALVPVLALLSNKEASLRLAAMKALKPMLSPGSGAADVLVDLLGDPNREVQLLAANYLGQIQARTATKRLLSIAKGSSDRELRLASIHALGEIRDSSVATELLELLASGPKALRRAAGNALINQGDDALIAPLLKLIRERRGDRPQLITVLAGVIRGTSNTQAAKELRRLAADSSRSEAVAAMVALGALGDRSATSTLVRLLESESIDRRRGAATALGHLLAETDPVASSLTKGTSPALKALALHLTDDDDGTTAASALALGKIKHKASVPLLVSALRRRGFAAPVNASFALAMLSSPEHSPVTNWPAFLHHSRRLVRANAVIAAGRAKRVELRGELEYLLAKDPSWLVRLNAARVLSQLDALSPRSPRSPRKSSGDSSGQKSESTSAILKRVAETDGSNVVREAAAALVEKPFSVPPRDTWITLMVVDPTSDDRVVAQEPYFMVGSDGLVTAAYSDVLGQITDEQVPAEPLLYAPMGAEREY